ncbi:MAG: hypothetical protein M1828_007551 [Chrysothrix sp. TS-e1954]|nr:MAG: hypothetical protein M1828_007551 [Chrysothrix sp. TS-e1954]
MPSREDTLYYTPTVPRSTHTNRPEHPMMSLPPSFRSVNPETSRRARLLANGTLDMSAARAPILPSSHVLPAQECKAQEVKRKEGLEQLVEEGFTFRPEAGRQRFNSVDLHFSEDTLPIPEEPMLRRSSSSAYPLEAIPKSRRNDRHSSSSVYPLEAIPKSRRNDRHSISSYYPSKAVSKIRPQNGPSPIEIVAPEPLARRPPPSFLRATSSIEEFLADIGREPPSNPPSSPKGASSTLDWTPQQPLEHGGPLTSHPVRIEDLAVDPRNMLTFDVDRDIHQRLLKTRPSSVFEHEATLSELTRAKKPVADLSSPTWRRSARFDNDPVRSGPLDGEDEELLRFAGATARVRRRPKLAVASAMNLPPVQADDYRGESSEIEVAQVVTMQKPNRVNMTANRGHRQQND